MLTLVSLTVSVGQAGGQQSRPQQSPSASGQVQQPAEKPPHVDEESNPEGRKVEHAIKADLQQYPHMTYSQVSVLATHNEIVLSGTVLTGTANQHPEHIAQKHAA